MSFSFGGTEKIEIYYYWYPRETFDERREFYQRFEF